MKYLYGVIIVASCFLAQITQSMQQQKKVLFRSDLAHRTTQIKRACAITADCLAETNAIVSRLTDPYEVPDADYTGRLAFGAGLATIGTYSLSDDTRTPTAESSLASITRLLHSKEAQYVGWGLAGSLAVWHWFIRPFKAHHARIQQLKSRDLELDQRMNRLKQHETALKKLSETPQPAAEAAEMNESAQLEDLYENCVVNKHRMKEMEVTIRSLGAQLQGLWGKQSDPERFNAVLAAYSSLCSACVFWQGQNQELLKAIDLRPILEERF